MFQDVPSLLESVGVSIESPRLLAILAHAEIISADSCNLQRVLCTLTLVCVQYQQLYIHNIYIYYTYICTIHILIIHVHIMIFDDLYIDLCYMLTVADSFGVCSLHHSMSFQRAGEAAVFADWVHPQHSGGWGSCWDPVGIPKKNLRPGGKFGTGESSQPGPGWLQHIGTMAIHGYPWLSMAIHHIHHVSWYSWCADDKKPLHSICFRCVP